MNQSMTDHRLPDGLKTFRLYSEVEARWFQAAGDGAVFCAVTARSS